ncbi:MAG: hypothetical protein R2831_03595 [Chitinophagaceae bacterium]
MVITFFTFENKKFLFLQNALFQSAQKIKLHTLILSGKKLPPPHWIYDNFESEHIVFDSSVPNWAIEKFNENASSEAIQKHIVSEQGAFIIDL